MELIISIISIISTIIILLSIVITSYYLDFKDQDDFDNIPNLHLTNLIICPEAQKFKIQTLSDGVVNSQKLLETIWDKIKYSIVTDELKSLSETIEKLIIDVNIDVDEKGLYVYDMNINYDLSKNKNVRNKNYEQIIYEMNDIQDIGNDNGEFINIDNLIQEIHDKEQKDPSNYLWLKWHSEHPHEDYVAEYMPRSDIFAPCIRSTVKNYKLARFEIIIKDVGIIPIEDYDEFSKVSKECKNKTNKWTINAFLNFYYMPR